jgi:ATP-dependent RNA circularization protein (DNA/RNA ligase family)
MSDFFRFPHTPHLAWLGDGTPRDDKVLAAGEVDTFLAHPVVLEEKVDGANLGFSVGSDGEMRAQNRGQYLHRPFTGQFARLNGWMAIHEKAVVEALGESLMLFGEWVAATHSLEYPRLPDYFLVFDVYDKNVRRFWSTARRDALAARLGLCRVHPLGTGSYRLNALRQLLATTPSSYRDGGCEGVYFRHEDKDWLISRAKLVHPDFVQSIGEHWRSRALRWNVLNTDQGFREPTAGN